MITYEQISEVMAYIADFASAEDAPEEGVSPEILGFCQANGIDLEVLNELADEGMMYLQLAGSQGIELGRELFRGGFLAGFRVAQQMTEAPTDGKPVAIDTESGKWVEIGPEDADRIATGRGGQA